MVIYSYFLVEVSLVQELLIIKPTPIRHGLDLLLNQRLLLLLLLLLEHHNCRVVADWRLYRGVGDWN